MTRTQIQLPDELYRRAKRFSAEREMSLAEMTRRGLEMLLERYPEERPLKEWAPPVIDCGGLRVPLESIRDYLYEDEMNRGRHT